MLIKHIRDVNRNPVATIVGHNGKVGIAVCSVKDNYSKKIGIDIASGRAKSDKFDAEQFICKCPSRLIPRKDDWGNGDITLYDLLFDEWVLMGDKLEHWNCDK